jgi:hypothetical protein
MRRVAFVGPRLLIDACVLGEPAGGWEPALIDHRGGPDPRELAAALEAAAPDVVVVLGPVAKGALGSRPVLRPPPPLPVADRFFADVRPWQNPPRALFVGASTDYRERFLIDAKHRHDLLHYAHGLWGDDLRRVLGRVDAGVNVHRDGAPAFEHRVALHLAAGHLLLSEGLAPAYGLRPEVDYVLIASSADLLHVLGALVDEPERYDAIRASGHAAAEAHRASVVWPARLSALVG